MKKYFYLCFTAMLLLFIAGCAQSSGESIVLPPTRTGSEGEFHASLYKHYTFNEAFSEADAVARIEVGNWLAEDNEIYKTYYEASVLQSYKGDMPESFTLFQDGNSSMTMEGYPLFTNGNELFLFLKKAINTDYENAYWIMGSFTTVLDVSYDETGERYYMDCYGIIGATMDISNNYAVQGVLASRLHDYAASKDPDVADSRYRSSFIFSENDVDDLISRQ